MVFSDILPAIRAILSERKRTLGFAAHFQLRCHVRQSRDSLMKIINTIVQNCAYLPVLDSAKLENNEETEELAERYFEVRRSLTASVIKLFSAKSDISLWYLVIGENICCITELLFNSVLCFLLHLYCGYVEAWLNVHC